MGQSRIGRWPDRGMRGSLVLALIPALCVTTAIISRVAAGPTWLAPNYDVQYPYLLNALRLQQGLRILFFQHPATTLAFLYSAIIDLSHVVAPAGRADLVEDVWRYPGVYIARVHSTLMVLVFAASFAAGFVVWRHTRSLSSGVAVQSGLILLSGIATGARLIFPDTVTIVVGMLFAATLTVFILDGGKSRRVCLTLAVLGALGVTSKFTFLVIACAPVVLARPRRLSLLYLAALAGATGLLTIPIWSRLPNVVDFLGGLFHRNGMYGGGGSGFDRQAYLAGGIILVLQNKIPVAILGLSVAVFLTSRRTTWFQPAERSEVRALGVLTLLEMAQYAIVARQPYPRYLWPAVLLMGVNLVIVQRMISTAAAPRRSVARAGLVLALAALSAVWLRNVTAEIGAMKQQRLERGAVADAADSLRKSGAVVVLGPWASSPASALAQGAYWTGDTWSSVGELLYPGQQFMRPDGQVRTWHDGLGNGWDWPGRQPSRSPGVDAQEWQRIRTNLPERRVIIQGDADLIIAGLQRREDTTFQVIHKTAFESLVELHSR